MRPMLFDRLVEKLRLDGAELVSVGPMEETVTLSSLPWGRSGGALTIHASEEELNRFAERLTNDDIEQLWPGEPRDEAGLNLVLAHLEEFVATRETPPLAVTLCDGGWEVRD